MAKAIGEKNGKWKGDDIKYRSLHSYIQNKKGKPSECKMCGRTDENTEYHWANKDHKYRRKLSDWIRLCEKCHFKYDSERYHFKNRRIEKSCKACGKRMKLKPAQVTKIMCTECAYTLKKLRSSAKYWEKKDPGSIKHEYWSGRYQLMINLINKK